MLSHPWIKSPRGRIPTIAVLRTLTTGRRYHRPVTTLVLFAFFSHQRSYTAPKMPPSEQPRGPATLLPAAPCSPAARPEGATINDFLRAVFCNFYAQPSQPTTMSLALGYSWLLPPAPRPPLAAQHSGLPAWPPTAPRWPSSRRLIGRRPCTREVNVCHSARSDILPSDRVRCSKCELLQ